MRDRRDEAVVGPRPAPGALALPLVLLAALLLGVTLAALPSPASAVTPVASEPRNRQKLSEQPGAVTLAFTREVDPSVAKVIVLGPDGKNVTSGPLVVEGTNVTSRLRADLGRGTYTVHFRVNGKNGQPEGGAYQFSYGDGSFSDLPDRSWSGEDAEPAVLRGTNPNGPDEPDPTTAGAGTPGIEVTSQAPSSDPNPPATEPPSTVKAPPGPTSDQTSEAASAPQTSVSATATPDSTGGSGTPWLVGGLLLLVALAAAGAGVWRSRAKGSGEHD